ncbi:MAG: sulfatase-like hydrolase/transferase [Planctomycetota bacterium]
MNTHSPCARTVIRATVLSLLLSAFCFADQCPNVVFILADDLGYGDLGCYGRDDIQTPRLDAMAKNGVKFTAHYANGPECSPTRAAFLTGRYQQWIGGLECAIGTGNIGRYDDAIRLRESHDLGLPTDIPTLPAMLRDAGYETAIFGKWHLGYEPKFSPSLHGFDHSYYCVGGEMDYFHFIDNVGGYNLFRDGDPIRDEGYFTDLMTDQAVRFLKTRRDKPFFLYLPYTCPHSPFQGPDQKQPNPLPLDSVLWKQGKAPRDVYVSMIEHMDKRIGDVLDAVDENTLVIFTSDNGGTKSARNEPFRGIKGSTFEGGIRVPAIMHWPDRLTAGATCDHPTMTFDWTRTIADLAGATFPETHLLEGVNLVKALSAEPPDRTLFWRKPRGDQIWKGVRDGDWKYIADNRAGVEREYLFDLSVDEREVENLIASEAEQAKRLRTKFDEWEKTTRANRRGRPNGLQSHWKSFAPREEIRPAFREEKNEALVITADHRKGLMGWWQRDFDVIPGQAYRFSAKCQTKGSAYPRREVLARIRWLSEDDQSVRRSPSDAVRTQPGGRAKAEPEFPKRSAALGDSIHLFSGTYTAPPKSAKARVELHLRWATPDARVRWSEVSLEETSRPPPRPVRLGAVHLRPTRASSNLGMCRQFARFVKQASDASVDLIVLPETVTYCNSGRSMADCAEPIPGPCSDFFGDLANENRLHLVVGLVERDGNLLYNVSVLFGPDGRIIGKYRKVSLPRGEVEAGLAPGNSLPVFDTSLGKVGMMICYDGFFPEVAQTLASNGAEIIAWPVWGCNPLLAKARACENHVYLVSSTYTASDKNWMRSAIYGHDGETMSEANEFGTLAIADVDLNDSLYWQSLGDFKAQLPAHRPVIE